MRSIDYNHSIVSVANSIRKKYGEEIRHPSLALLDKTLKNSRSNIVFVVLDGFGTNLLELYKQKTEFLRIHRICDVDSVFPTSTPVAMASIHTGLCPIEHGWIGATRYFPKEDKIVKLFKGTDIENDEPVPAALQGLKFSRMSNTVAKCRGVMSYNKEFMSANLPNDLYNALYAAYLRSQKYNNTFSYIYVSQPDTMLHLNGINSEEAKAYAEIINNTFRSLAREMGGATTIVIADHGQTDVRYLEWEELNPLTKYIERPISLESRAATFFVKEGKHKKFLEEFHKITEHKFELISRNELIASHMFGDGTPADGIYESIGDFTAITDSNIGLRLHKPSAKAAQYISSHSGLSEDEVRVPVIVIN